MRELIERLEEAKKSPVVAVIEKIIGGFRKSGVDRYGEEWWVEGSGDAVKQLIKLLKAEGFKKLSGPSVNLDEPDDPNSGGSSDTWFKHPKLGAVWIMQEYHHGRLENPSRATIKPWKL
jgi:hypothetical protein